MHPLVVLAGQHSLLASVIETSTVRDSSASMASSGSTSRISTRSLERVARSEITGTATALTAELKVPSRTVPASPRRKAARSDSACSRWVKIWWAWLSRSWAASVSRTRRPSGSSIAVPASRDSEANCCDTADGVRCTAAAVAAIVPQRSSSRRISNFRTSIMQSILRIRGRRNRWTWDIFGSLLVHDSHPDPRRPAPARRRRPAGRRRLPFVTGVDSQRSDATLWSDAECGTAVDRRQIADRGIPQPAIRTVRGPEVRPRSRDTDCRCGAELC